jgi:CheY-like chemotaxis protein
MLGGDVVIVASRPGEGTRARVTVEAAAAEPPPAAGATTAAAPDRSLPVAPKLAGRRVLLAEDGPDNQRMLALLLQKAGAEVAVADDGAAALARVAAARDAGQRFDVILMDMQMPVLDGYQATRKLRAQGYAGPIVALTAHAMPTSRQECLDAGCNDYASKPIGRQTLLALVAKHLAPHRTEAAHAEPSTAT